jgi:hypothetical protein
MVSIAAAESVQAEMKEAKTACDLAMGDNTRSVERR